jgi:hypothetical protein
MNLFSPGGGIVLPRHPATPSSLVSNLSPVSTNGNSSSNAKNAFFSISNLVNGLRQRQDDVEKGKDRLATNFPSILVKLRLTNN